MEVFMRVYLGFLALLFLGCSGSGTNPGGNCSTNPGLCGAGQVCDSVTNQCVSADMGASGPKGICSADGWCWRNPLPQGNYLSAAWGTSANSVWVVGDFGTILNANEAPPPAHLHPFSRA